MFSACSMCECDMNTQFMWTMAVIGLLGIIGSLPVRARARGSELVVVARRGSDPAVARASVIERT